MKECGLSDDVIGAITYSYGDYGTPPAKSPFFVQAFMQSHYHGGAFFPKGGSTSIAKTLVAAIQRRGGKVFAAAPVEKVMTAKSYYYNFGAGYKATGVIVKGMEVHARKCVISDAGFFKTFEAMGEASTPLVHPVAGARQLELVHYKETDTPFTPSFAFFYLFVGLNGTDQELGLPGQNIWHLADWNLDKNEHDFYAHPSIEETMDLPPPLVFVSNESAKDPEYVYYTDIEVCAVPLSFLTFCVSLIFWNQFWHSVPGKVHRDYCCFD